MPTAHPSTTRGSVTAARRGSPLPPGRWCVQHTSGTACAIKGASRFCRIKQRKLYSTIHKQTQVPTRRRLCWISFLHDTPWKSQNYPHPAFQSVDSKPDVQLCKKFPSHVETVMLVKINPSKVQYIPYSSVSQASLITKEPMKLFVEKKKIHRQCRTHRSAPMRRFCMQLAHHCLLLTAGRHCVCL